VDKRSPRSRPENKKNKEKKNVAVGGQLGGGEGGLQRANVWGSGHRGPHLATDCNTLGYHKSPATGDTNSPTGRYQEG